MRGKISLHLESGNCIPEEHIKPGLKHAGMMENFQFLSTV
jgi:hypothetical protein